LQNGHPRPGFLYEFALTTIGVNSLSPPSTKYTVKMRKLKFLIFTYERKSNSN